MEKFFEQLNLLCYSHKINKPIIDKTQTIKIKQEDRLNLIKEIRELKKTDEQNKTLFSTCIFCIESYEEAESLIIQLISNLDYEILTDKETKLHFMLYPNNCGYNIYLGIFRKEEIKKEPTTFAINKIELLFNAFDVYKCNIGIFCPRLLDFITRDYLCKS